MGAAERTVRSSVTAGESGAPSQSNLARCFARSEEHTSEFQSRLHLVCRLLLEKKTGRAPPPVRSAPCRALPPTLPAAPHSGFLHVDNAVPAPPPVTPPPCPQPTDPDTP